MVFGLFPTGIRKFTADLPSVAYNHCLRCSRGLQITYCPYGDIIYICTVSIFSISCMNHQQFLSISVNVINIKHLSQIHKPQNTSFKFTDEAWDKTKTKSPDIFLNTRSSLICCIPPASIKTYLSAENIFSFTQE